MYIIDLAKRNGFLSGLHRRFAYTRNFPNLFIRNKADITYAAVHLYASGTPFANLGRTRQPRMTDRDEIQRTLVPFVDKVWNYFNLTPNTPNTQPNYDVFHDQLCQLFVALFTAEGYPHTYGNAQKMVSMLFKYLTCFADYEIFAGLFNYCHIPIDRQILIAFAERYDVANTQRAGTYCGICWTRMDRETYLRLLADYRTALAPLLGDNSYLGAEYYIWKEEELPTQGIQAILVKEFYR